MPTPEAQSRRTHIALFIAAAAIALSLITAGLALVQRFSATNAARHDNALVWHAVICQIERVVYHRPHVTPTERRVTIKFYNSLLVDDVKAKACSAVEIRRATTPRR